MECKISVCLISGAYPPSRDGIGDYTAKLIDGLNRQGLEISLVTSDEEPVHRYIAQNNIARIFPIIKRWNIFAIVAIMKLIAKEKFDIIHLQFPSSRYKKTFSLCFLPLLIRLFSKTKVIVTLHEFSISHPINKLRQVLLGLSSHRVIITDDNDAAQLKKYMLGSRKSKFIPIGSNIDVYEYNPEEKELFLKKMGLNNQAKVIAFFGFIHRNKGLEWLLEAVSKVINDGFLMQVVIISQVDFVNNPYHNEIKKMIDSLAINNSLFITGYAPAREVSEFLSLSDICVLPFTDGVTLRRGTLMAALAHGKAVISTKSKEYVPSQLIDKQNICLVPVGDVRKMAEAIESLCIDDKLKEEIEKGAGVLARDFSWDRIAQKHKELYQELTGNLR